LSQRVLPALLAILGLFATQVGAFDPVPWSSSLREMADKAGKNGSVPSPPILVPASAEGPRGNSLLRDLRPAVAVPTPTKSVPKPHFSASPEKNSQASHAAVATVPARRKHPEPKVQAKALCCLDCSSDKMILAKNISEPLPIASITKLLTAMIAVDGMSLDQVVEVPADIMDVPPHKVGLRPGDLLTVKDLLYGLLMESGNDCAEALARAYPKGGRHGFISAMNRRVGLLGASTATIYTPSGLDMKITLGRKDGRTLEATKPNVASVKDVAIIARAAFNYPLISEISSTRAHSIVTRNETPRTYRLASTIKLLNRNLPVAGAKTGFTNLAGRCIVALFKDHHKETMVVVLNSPRHFKAAENIYRWLSKGL
jgi:D-alanyl-D-alanine carboxypeptidase